MDIMLSKKMCVFQISNIQNILDVDYIINQHSFKKETGLNNGVLKLHIDVNIIFPS